MTKWKDGGNLPTVIMHEKPNHLVWSYRNIYIADWSWFFSNPGLDAECCMSTFSHRAPHTLNPIRQLVLTSRGQWDRGAVKPIQLSDVARTSWENLEGGGCAFRRDFDDNVTVAIFAANNNTSRLLENTSNKFWLHAHTYILIITLYTNTHEQNIQQHCHAFWYEFLWSLKPVKRKQSFTKHTFFQKRVLV